MKEERARLEALIRKELQAGVADDDRDDAEFGDRRGDELPPELVHPAKRSAAIKAAMAALEAEAAAEQVHKPAAVPSPAPKSRNERSNPKGGSAVQSPSLLPPEAPADGGTPSPAIETPPVVPDKAQYNFTDPESRIMLTSSKALEPCYNAQAAVDSPSQIHRRSRSDQPGRRRSAPPRHGRSGDRQHRMGPGGGLRGRRLFPSPAH